MNDRTPQEAIRQIVERLLEHAADENLVQQGLNEIHAQFQSLTGISGQDFVFDNMAAVVTARGKALGLNHAAQCLLDYKRTIKILQGLVAAIRQQQGSAPGKTVHIFYAGCGPYAPFVSMVAPLFQPDELQFALLEINKGSLHSAKALIQGLGLSDYVLEYYEADAVTFEVPNADRYDILYSETLDALLYRECYVPILFNLLPQFSEDVKLIPQNVEVNLTSLSLPLADPNHKSDHVRNIVDVRAAISTHPAGNPIPPQLPEVKVPITTIEPKDFHSLLLETRVHILDDIWLERGESSLTLPLEMNVPQHVREGTFIFTYYMEPEIELKASLV